MLLYPFLAWGDSGTLVETFLRQFEQYAADSTNRFILLAAIACATFISEDLACIAAGLLAAKQIISPFEAVAASALGIYVGDILLYLAGYVVGITAIDRVPLKYLVSKRTVEQCQTLFERRGMTIIFMSRFLPGTRTATFLAAGLARVNLVRLLVVFGLAVLLWTPVLVLGAMIAGKQAVHYVELYSSYALLVFAALLFGLYFITRLIVPLFTWRGRRLALSKWRRLTRWEFWPYYVTNSVTFLYVFFLGVFRYRNPTLFTVVNPAIKPDSGFIGESKSDILRGLPQESVGCWEFIGGSVPFDDKAEIVWRFMAENEFDFPIVLKPDQGQRGQGVGICRDRASVEKWLKEVRQDFIVMEFLDGEEFGVFYYRFPSAAEGTIFSITRKKLISVYGDGKHTLEELILLDERALCLAPMFLKKHEADLLDILPDGEKKQLVQVGTHSLGSLFLDGADLVTAELLAAIENIAQPYEGFFFGRFDLKAASEQDLCGGRGLKVMELNGVTSEPTHMYDPGNSVIYAWKTLFQQWSIAFQISEENRQRGFQPMTSRSFVNHWIGAGRRPPATALQPSAESSPQ
jgi:membrane protein DedA with SNARE-associated domain